jgi:hypothetical protein
MFKKLGNQISDGAVWATCSTRFAIQLLGFQRR